MAYDKAILQNPHTGQIKEAPMGFSWTMFFFSFFAPIFRGDWKWFGIVLGLSILLSLMSFGLLGWVPGIVGAFVWNKSYLNGLISQGYRLRGVESGQIERADSFAGFTLPRVEAMA